MMNRKYPVFLITIVLVVCMGNPSSAKTMKDQLNRAVRMPDHPKRIVALAPSITEIIFSLGQEHRLKGVTQFSDFPPDALKLPKVGS